MLSAENTDLLCRVGRGTPMGDLMRQYWLPVGYSWEYEAEGQPQRVRVLGEDLVVWRTLDGTPAFTQANCPHRGAGFFYGRTEEEGAALRVPRLEVRRRRSVRRHAERAR